MSDELQIIIMAAGLGTRMKSRTVKVLHRAAGRPLIDYVVDLAHEISDAAPVVVVGHQREAVQQHVGDRCRFGERSRDARAQVNPELAHQKHVRRGTERTGTS